MRKFIFGCFLLFQTAAFSQVFSSDFENWTNNLPDGWMGASTNIGGTNITQISDAQSGTSACRLTNTESSHKRFTTATQSVVSGTSYQISFWAKGTGDVRTGIGIAPYTVSDFAYNSYVNLTGTWTQYTQNVVAATTSADAQFIFSVRNSAAPNHVQIDNVVITEATINTVSIYDIQFTANPDGISPLNGQIISTEGVVTGTYQSGTSPNFNYGYFIQDGNGPWNGIHVFQGSNSNLPTIGNELKVTGSVTEFNGLTQITNSTRTLLNAQATLPTPEDINTVELSQEEKYEGVLVRVVDAECTNPNSGFGMWQLNDGTGNAKAHNLMFNFTPTLGSVYSVTGVVNYAFDEYRICYRNADDIVVEETNTTITPIFNIQNTTDPTGASPLLDQFVTTTGIVTGIRPNDGYFLQAIPGAWNGIYVYSTTSQPAVGDSIVLTGRVTEYFGMTQLSTVTNMSVLASGKPLPAFTDITTAQVNTEAFEAVLIRIPQANCTNANAGFGMFELNDGSGICKADDDIFAFTPIQNRQYLVSGPVFYSFSEFKILPRFTSDVQLLSGLNELDPSTFQVHPNPTQDYFAVSSTQAIERLQIFDNTGRLVYNAQPSLNEVNLNVNEMNAGVYLVMISTSQGIGSKRLVVIK
jgi:predicted extracellular nuclease